MEMRKLLGIGILGGIAYLAWKKGLFGGQARADAALETAATSELDACGNAPASAQAFVYASGGVAQATPTATPVNTDAMWAGVAGKAATQIAGSINPVAGAVVGVASTVATTIFSIFGGADVPPDPALNLLVAEMPYNWQVFNSNLPPGATIYALDRCGYVHPLNRDVASAGYNVRDVIAIDWKVFSMLPHGAQITNIAEMQKTAMPRPADPRVMRSVLGNDIRFYVGRETRLRGPGDGDANVPPAPGTPAEWAEIAGSYHPTQTASPGEW